MNKDEQISRVFGAAYVIFVAWQKNPKELLDVVTDGSLDQCLSHHGSWNTGPAQTAKG